MILVSHSQFVLVLISDKFLLMEIDILVHFSDLLIFIAIITFPVAVAKWLMAILQGSVAAKNLAAIDVADRVAQRQKAQ